MDTSLFSNINWLAVLVAAVAYFALGALWYSKVLFVNSWIKLTGVNMNAPGAKSGVAQTMISSFILMAIACVALAVLIGRIGIAGWMTGLKVGLIAGICFAATSVGISYLYEKRPLALYLINCGYNIVGCCIAGIIIASWPK
jgi:hypothetical protein